MTPEKTAKENPGIIKTQLHVIYADKISNLAVGPAISKLTLAMEGDDKSTVPFSQIVIPTPVLFQTIEFLIDSVYKNKDLKDKLIDGVEALKNEIIKTKEKFKD
jgi:hypothetical protein